MRGLDRGADAKFITREQTNAALHEESGRLGKRKAQLAAQQQALVAKLTEAQYNTGAPAQTETALKQLDPKLIRASHRLQASPSEYV